MQIAFRVDASATIGTGHLMRCLTLAESLKARGARTRFVLRQVPDFLRDMACNAGHEVVELGPPETPAEPCLGDLRHSSWLGTGQYRDAEDTSLALSDGRWDWVVVDHYALDARWETALRESAEHILAIDDLADRPHDCDVLLDQNFYRDLHRRYESKVSAHTQCLLGPRYALLRREFGQWRTQVAPRRGPVRRILVFFGGVDADNHTLKAVEALGGIQGRHQVDVIIGAAHPCRDQVARTCRSHGYRCLIQPPNIAELMVQADLSMGGGGSTSWERCCLGVPTVALCLAENQRQLIVDAATAGLLYAPDPSVDLVSSLRRHLAAILDNASLREAISRRGMEMVDGRGALRIARQMGCGEVEVRPAEASDARDLFQWRNHPANRRYARDPAAIPWEAHERWLAGVLSDPDRQLLVGYRQKRPVGVVRFDVRGPQAEVSIYLVPGNDGMGHGSELLGSAERWLKGHRPEVQQLRALILNDNFRSRMLFEAQGYRAAQHEYRKRLHPT